MTIFASCATAPLERCSSGMGAAVPACELLPKVVPVNTDVLLTVRAVSGDAFRDSAAECQVRITPMEWKGSGAVADAVSVRVKPEAGMLRFHYRFQEEQEYAIGVSSADALQPVADLRVFALNADLFPLRPWKGDVHQHSNWSDGHEEPAHVAAFNRKIGMDFMALTDHCQYVPSLEAIQAFAGVPVDLRIYPGEEVHPPDTFVHIVNFGGKASVNDFCREPAYGEETQRIADSLEEFPTGLDARSYASCLWAFDRIRAVGGLAIFCHPYWVTGSRYNVPEALIARLFAEQPFDAYELVGGYWLEESESNVLQIARYYQEAAAGRRVPVVGASDGHGATRGLHGWYYTVVLAPSPQFSDLREAILAERSVAVEHLPGAPAPRPYGPFRLVKYVGFLLREVLPLHDALCAEEGELMLAHAAGDPTAPGKLKALQGRTTALYRTLWAGG